MNCTKALLCLFGHCLGFTVDCKLVSYQYSYSSDYRCYWFEEDF